MEKKTISHFRILKLLGGEGGARIYLAEDTVLKRKVVLKFLPARFTSTRFLKARFKRETQAAAALRHPNIITVYELVENVHGFYIAMEYVRGKSLNEWLKRAHIAIPTVLDITMQMCRGLRRAHNAGIVHGNVKPANILIDTGGWVKILDFGFAHIREAESLNEHRVRTGSTAHMSPEQILGFDLDQRSDLYSLGIILYQLLTGKIPFGGLNNEELHFAILHRKPEPITRYKTEITPGLQEIIDKALAKDQKSRFQHVDDLLSDLKRERRVYENAHKSTINLDLPSRKSEPKTFTHQRKIKKRRTWLDFGFALPLFLLPALTLFLFFLWFLNDSGLESKLHSLKNSVTTMRKVVQKKGAKTAGPFTALSATSLSRPPHKAEVNMAHTSQKRQVQGRLSPIIEELTHISKTKFLLKNLNRYYQMMLVSVGNKEDFNNFKNCYVFVVDPENVLNCFQFNGSDFLSLSTYERFLDLSGRYPGKTSIWIQDHSLSSSLAKFISKQDIRSNLQFSPKDRAVVSRYTDERYVFVVYDLEQIDKPAVFSRSNAFINNGILRLGHFSRFTEGLSTLSKREFSSKF
ncbi:MAG: serine/threonine protein kinase [bacterium]